MNNDDTLKVYSFFSFNKQIHNNDRKMHLENLTCDFEQWVGYRLYD
jgi:hypothetical protein